MFCHFVEPSEGKSRAPDSNFDVPRSNVASFFWLLEVSSPLGSVVLSKASDVSAESPFLLFDTLGIQYQHFFLSSLISHKLCKLMLQGLARDVYNCSKNGLLYSPCICSTQLQAVKSYFAGSMELNYSICICRGLYPLCEATVDHPRLYMEGSSLLSHSPHSRVILGNDRLHCSAIANQVVALTMAALYLLLLKKHKDRVLGPTQFV